MSVEGSEQRRFGYLWQCTVYCIEIKSTEYNDCESELKGSSKYLITTNMITDSMDFENIAIVNKARNYHNRLFLEAWYCFRDPNVGILRLAALIRCNLAPREYLNNCRKALKVCREIKDKIPQLNNLVVDRRTPGSIKWSDIIIRNYRALFPAINFEPGKYPGGGDTPKHFG